MSENNDSVTLSDAAEMDTGKVSAGGQLFVGKEYGGKEVKYVFRVEEEAEEADEPEESDVTADAESA